MERCVPSKHLSPFALLSSSTVLGWPQGLSDNAPAPGQRCMDVFPNTWGHPGYAQLHLVKPIAALAIARNCKANVWQLFPLRDAGDMCTEAPRNTKMPIPKERSIRSACKCWRPMQSRAAVFRLTLVHVKHNRPEQVQWKTRKNNAL